MIKHETWKKVLKAHLAQKPGNQRAKNNGIVAFAIMHRYTDITRLP